MHMPCDMRIIQVHRTDEIVERSEAGKKTGEILEVRASIRVVPVRQPQS